MRNHGHTVSLKIKQLTLISLLRISNSFTTVPCVTLQSQSTTTFLSAKKQSRSTLLEFPTKSNSTAVAAEENESNNEVYGSKFFGGNAIKEDLFDAEVEANVDRVGKLYPRKPSTAALPDDEEYPVYKRFEDKNAFPDEDARAMAQRLQLAFSKSLYETEKSSDKSDDISRLYSSKLNWRTPFRKSSTTVTTNPVDELSNVLEYYKRVDVAILSSRSLSSLDIKAKEMEVRWEISLLWPNALESRVLVTGKSIITVDYTDYSKPVITSQVDTLDCGGEDGQDTFTAIAPQLQPRFWDLYHVGMTPSTECMPRINEKAGGGIFGFAYSTFKIPPRVVMKPTLVDLVGREAREAQGIPNQAFTTIIKTTGRSGQRYVPTTPLEVAIRRGKKAESTIEWSIYLPPEFVSYGDELPLPNLEEEEKKAFSCSYLYQPRRFVATAKYGGQPQDEGVSAVRKKLYEQVLKDGLKPMLNNESGKPNFFFLQNDCKVCFTADGGLGMAVYDWRPESANSNEVGIELELDV